MLFASESFAVYCSGRLRAEFQVSYSLTQDTVTVSSLVSRQTIVIKGQSVTVYNPGALIENVEVVLADKSYVMFDVYPSSAPMVKMTANNPDSILDESLFQSRFCTP